MNWLHTGLWSTRSFQKWVSSHGEERTEAAGDCVRSATFYDAVGQVTWTETERYERYFSYGAGGRLSTMGEFLGHHTEPLTWRLGGAGMPRDCPWLCRNSSEFPGDRPSKLSENHVEVTCLVTNELCYNTGQGRLDGDRGLSA